MTDEIRMGIKGKYAHVPTHHVETVEVDKRRLEALERVADLAREIANVPPVMDAGRHTLYELREPDMQPLRDALEGLK